MKFGEFLKQERDLKEWKQPEASHAIGIEQSYLSKLENGKAIPSAEVFDQLMEAYGFDLAKMGELVNDSELEKFKEIVVIRDFIMKERHQSVDDRRKWLKRGLVGVMLGGGLLTYGHLPVDAQVETYMYESKGVILEGESRFIFAEMPSYENYMEILQHNRLRNQASNRASENKDTVVTNEQMVEGPSGSLRTHKLFPRLDYKVRRSDHYSGEFYDSDARDGSRRFFLTDTSYAHVNSNNMLSITLGVMLLLGGLGSFFISRRW